MTEQSIWNGTAVAAGVRQDVVWVRHPVDCSLACQTPPPTPPCNANCTGTLLRNNVVLTARHCLTSDMKVNGPIVDASSIRVYQSQSGTEFVTASQVQTRPLNEDVAVIFLNSPVSVAGITWAHQTPIYPYRADEHVNQVLPVFGYGVNRNENGCTRISAPNMLSGQVKVETASQQPINVDGFFTKVPIRVTPTDASGTAAPWFGDSGSAMFSSLSTPASAYGVLTGTFPGPLAIFPSDSHYGSPEDYRAWILARVVATTPNLTDTFPAASSVDVYDRLGQGGSSQNWTWTSAGVQESSASGAKYLVNRSQIVENAIVSAKVVSGDFAGIITRWVDDEHYYMARFRDSDNSAQILKRVGGFWQVLVSTLGCDFSWSTNPNIIINVSGGSIQGFMQDGGTVKCLMNAIDTAYPTGRTGVYKQNGTFKMNRFDVVHLTPSGAGWNRP